MRNRVAFVTGVGPNIGTAIARTLAAAGMAVVCNDLAEGPAAATAAEIERAGGRALAAVGDVTDPAFVAATLDRAEAAFGPVDVLVNNALHMVAKGLVEIDLAEWQRSIDVILTGAFVCSQAVARRLIAHHEPGTIVNIASSSGHRGRPDAIAYCTAKGGVLNMTRAMAVDLAPHHIRVCSISPTRTGTGTLITGTVHRAPNEIPLGRLGEPQDIASAVEFLVSDRAAFITGQDLLVDGGTLATWGRGSGL